LLYVALTRAEERLYVGGSLGARDRDGAPESSWHRAVETALAGLGCDWVDSPGWGREMRFGSLKSPGRIIVKAADKVGILPDWIGRPAPEEERPPRPLSPTAPAEDDLPWPPPNPGQREAARRGRLLHQLFERLPGVAPERRAELAACWLERSAGVADAALRDALVADACRIVADPRFADLFGPEALAEAPVAAVLGDGAVVSGTVDRLLVRAERVLVADFKTGRIAPDDVADIPPAHLRQMAVYRAALATIFPDRPVEAVLLYTAGPVLHALPGALLDAHLPAGAYPRGSG
jgi:ATP-dependent helicase/nuclease subunit A